MDYSDKMQGSSGLGLNEFVEALELEKQKIQVFQKELPLSLELVTQAIERCKQQLSGTTVEYLHGQSEFSEQTSSEGHVFEEFIPMKRTSSSDNDEDDDDEEHSNKPKNNSKEKKTDWLRSVQLWNPNPDPPVKEEMPRKAKVELNKNGGAFQPFQREKSVGKTFNGSVCKAPPSAPGTSSSAVTVSEGNGGGVIKEEKESQSQRKQRRNWSPELHRRFLNALQQLGGSHAATPKQIRELMKVDGLTNDEVKSHLQKYRLHNRRPSATLHNNSNAQTPQFVVVGGLWVSPPDYATIATTTTTTTTATAAEPSNVGRATGVYAPVAQPQHKITREAGSVIQKQQTKHSESSLSDERASTTHSEREVHSNSTATSSSTHMTTSEF